MSRSPLSDRRRCLAGHGRRRRTLSPPPTNGLAMNRFAQSLGAAAAPLMLALALVPVQPASAQTPVAPAAAPAAYVLRPARVFDALSAQAHDGWVVVVERDRIAAVGPATSTAVPAGAETIDLPGATLLPGLIEGHS